MEVLKLSVDKWKGSPQQSIHILFNHEIPCDPTEKKEGGGRCFQVLLKNMYYWNKCGQNTNVSLSFVKATNLINNYHRVRWPLV